VCDDGPVGSSGNGAQSSSGEEHVVQDRQGGRLRVLGCEVRAGLPVCEQGFQVSLARAKRGHLPLYVRPPTVTGRFQGDT